MYRYEEQRHALFTETGQEMFLKVRDRTKYLIGIAGAASLGHIMAKVTGDSWFMMACVDRMVELGEIVEVTKDQDVWGQHRIFTTPSRTM